jgi:mannose-6-phosphate isomerase-like protein (cupin superfamily)
MTDLAARAVRPGRIPAKASCRPEDHRLPSADGTDDGDRHRGRRQADGQKRSSRRPPGSSLAPASEHRYRSAASPSNSSSAPGQTAERLSITEMTLDPHRLAPPHVHADEDEYTYVAAGTIGVRVADEEFEAAQGC